VDRLIASPRFEAAVSIWRGVRIPSPGSASPCSRQWACRWIAGARCRWTPTGRFRSCWP